jgi:hypothetical protein
MAKSRQRPYNQWRAEIAQLVEQLTCNEQVPGSSPGLGSVNQFRRSKCYASRMKAGSCLECGNVLKKRWQSKYCSNKCQADHQYRRCIAEWKSNSRHALRRVATKNICRHLKRYLIEVHGEKCSLCGWNERHPVTKRIPLEVDHIDGNAENNTESNLRIICPNCHSLTVHFRNLNRTRGRAWRARSAKRNDAV